MVYEVGLRLTEAKEEEFLETRIWSRTTNDWPTLI